MSFVRSLSLGFQFIWGTINRSSELLETLMSEDFWVEIWCGTTSFSDYDCGCERCWDIVHPSANPDRISHYDLTELAEMLKLDGANVPVITRAIWAGLLPDERDTAISLTQHRIMENCSEGSCLHNRHRTEFIEEFEYEMFLAEYMVGR